MSKYKTHNCGELRITDVEKQVTLSGWVHSIRSHGLLSFIDLRDRFGLTQIVLDSSLVKNLRKESTISITGKVIKKENPNKALLTGEIEIRASSIEVLSLAEPLPLDENASDDTRLKYRYLDLRRPEMIKNLKLRHDVLQAARDYFDKNEFLEIDTPMLVKSTPEGARDYLVPSRINKGQFYALPQSPQLYKQILMIAGVDRYFQIAKCLRDEDLRMDRQPEHTQLDLEMSFVTQEEIRGFVEGLYKHIFKQVLGLELEDFKVFSYKEALETYGSDKPDIRFGLELKDITAIAKKSDFSIFNDAETIKCIVVQKEFTRKEIDEFTHLAKVYGANGLASLKVKDNALDGSISKYIPATLQQELIKNTQSKEGSSIIIISGKKKTTQIALGQIRLKIRDMLALVNPKEFKFAWIIDFPLFSWNEDEQKWEPEHHMFSMPKPEFVQDFEKRPGEVLGDLYDITLNGLELGSGSIRVTNPLIQKRIMNFIGLSEEEANQKFGFLLEAYKYGAPIHGGMGLGLDRLVALMAGTSDIREVIAFPKNKNAQCPMDGCPNDVSKTQLDELGISINKTG
ncbi:MAG TPA: aspartate--tRNA ligase [Candidatus Woesearchaeota archaeon]|nr:aspartate--tRNA ligase [Candidatus Woesearchaeota archaeon]